jgi:two-component system phosphate regulon sensor histidine kinase PhoR
MKQKINLRLIGTAVIAVLATAIGITFIYYGFFKKQVQAGLRTNAEVLMDTGVFDRSSANVDVKLPINNLRVTWIDSDGAVLIMTMIFRECLTIMTDLRFRKHFRQDTVSV